MSQTDMIYLNFFGLDRRPFSLLPDPASIYWSEAHLQAYAVLRYAVATFAPITVITGEVGAGKTTLVRNLLNDMPPDTTVGLLSNAQGNRLELLQWILMALGIDGPEQGSYVRLYHTLQDFLIAEYAAGRRTVLIVDEAQHLTAETLEELRMYSNINSDDNELLQIILVGQPKMRDLISKPAQTGFAQRIAAEFHLPQMSVDDVQMYVRHRMAQSGVPEQVFSDSACAAVHAATSGIPRLVNQICEYALVYAFSMDRPEVGVDVIDRVVADRKRFGAVVAPDGRTALTDGRVPHAGGRLSRLRQRIADIDEEEDDNNPFLLAQDAKGDAS